MKDYMFNHINTRCAIPVEIMIWGKGASLFLIITVSLIFSCSQPQKAEFRSRAGMTTFEFPDGSQVTLREGSVLSYNHDFGVGQREVTLDGEGFFEISHDPRRRFIAHCNGVTVTVLGTAFNIRLAATGEVEVTVSNGKVNVKDDRRNFGDLQSRDQALVDPARHEVRFKEDADLGKTLAWYYEGLATGIHPMGTVTSALEHRFGARIILENKALHDYQITSQPDFNEPLEVILEIIVLPTNARVIRRPNNTYIIRGGHRP